MRRAAIETRFDDATAAATIAAALRPDNTASMTTGVDGAVVRTTIERETTGGLQSTVDDYVVNLTVAESVTRTATGGTDAEPNADDRHTTHDNE